MYNLNKNMNKKQKGSTLILLVLIVLILAGIGAAGYYLINQDSQKYADWKTYENKVLGYEIKYPNDWIHREYPNTQTGAGFRPINSDYEFININAMTGAEMDYNIPFNDYVKEAAIKEIQGFEKLNSIEEISTATVIKGYKTTWIYSDMNSNDKNISLPITYFDYKKTVGDFKYMTIQVSLGDKEYEEIYEQMLSTLKIIK